MTILIGVSGGLSIDHIVSEGAGARFGCLGGPGLYAAAGARLVDGVVVRLHAELPESTTAFAAVLSTAGVDTSLCTYVPDVPRVWILNSTQGRRVVRTAPTPGLELGADDEIADTAAPAVPSSDFFQGLKGVLFSSPNSIGKPPAGVTVGVDPDQHHVMTRGMDYLRAITVAGGVVLPSRIQLAFLQREPRQAARHIAAALHVDVVARLDTDGMYAVGADGGEWTVRDTRLSVLDTTGAGDTSAGTVVAALAAGADLPTAAALGVSAARIVMSDWGFSALARSTSLTDPLPGIHITTG